MSQPPKPPAAVFHDHDIYLHGFTDHDTAKLYACITLHGGAPHPLSHLLPAHVRPAKSDIQPAKSNSPVKSGFLKAGRLPSFSQSPQTISQQQQLSNLTGNQAETVKFDRDDVSDRKYCVVVSRTRLPAEVVEEITPLAPEDESGAHVAPARGAVSHVVSVSWVLDSLQMKVPLPTDSAQYGLEEFLARIMFVGMKFTILQYDNLSKDVMGLTEDRILEAGGLLQQPFDPLTTTHLIIQYACGPEFEEICQLRPQGYDIKVATLHWLHDCLANAQVSDPTASVLNFPFPEECIPGLKNMEICITGYMGQARADIKDMITVTGAAFTGPFTQKNAVLISCQAEGQKYEKALEWKIPVVNHRWLEDTVVAWQRMPMDLPKYTCFPTKELIASVGKVPCPPHQVALFASTEPPVDHDIIWETPRTQQGETTGRAREKRPLSQASDGVVRSTGDAPGDPAGVESPPERKSKRQKPATPEVALKSEVPELLAPLKTLRSPKGKQAKPKVMFTGIKPEEKKRYELKIRNLGGEIVTSSQLCTHMVAKEIIRTAKFLSAICLGNHILSLDWVTDSEASGKLLPESKYHLKDREGEKEFAFSLAESLEAARNKKLLENKLIFLSPKVKDQTSLGEIIECAGGKVIQSLTRKQNDEDLLVLSCDEDRPWRLEMSERYPSLQFYSSQLLLNGTLRQTLDYSAAILK